MRLRTESVVRSKTDDKGEPRGHISNTFLTSSPPDLGQPCSRSGPALFPSPCTPSNALTSASTRPANYKASVSPGQGSSLWQMVNVPYAEPSLEQPKHRTIRVAGLGEFTN